MRTQCETCGAEFDGKRNDRHHKRPRRFCSKICQSRAQIKRVVPPPEFFQRQCELCGTSFDATPARPKYEPPKRFCRKCVGRGRNLVKFNRVTITCKQCGKIFDVPHSRFVCHKTQFCSRQCKHENWRAGGNPILQKPKPPSIGIDGYVLIHAPEHPEAKARRQRGVRNYRLREHRLVMEKMLGRPLLPNETPHHKFGDRQDNRTESLELWVKTQPSGQRVSDLIDYVVRYHREAVVAALQKLQS